MSARKCGRAYQCIENSIRYDRKFRYNLFGQLSSINKTNLLRGDNSACTASDKHHRTEEVITDRINHKFCSRWRPFDFTKYWLAIVFFFIWSHARRDGIVLCVNSIWTFISGNMARFQRFYCPSRIIWMHNNLGRQTSNWDQLSNETDNYWNDATESMFDRTIHAYDNNLINAARSLHSK